MKFDVAPAPHARPTRTLRQVMGLVLLALIPAALVHVWMFGPGLIINALIATLTAVAAEAACLRLRGRAYEPAVADLSAVLCAVLLAFCLPPLTPWYVTATGAAFAIVVAKQVYGGLGANLFNPAMAGYLVVLVSFPEAMTRWPALGDGNALSWLDSARLILIGAPPSTTWDAVTMATPLDQVRIELSQMRMLSEVLAGDALPGRGAWLAFQIAAAAGGVALLSLGIIRWQLPVATLAGVIVAASALNLADGDSYASAWFHLSTGSAVFAAMFIVTDPVTAATSARGRLVFGFGIGVLAIVIRTFGAYPDGMAFAVLLMNAAVPLIDRVSVPRAYGHGSNRDTDTLS